jgi:uncharacterized membrane protein YphA (DoxX/SURF4 family)
MNASSPLFWLAALRIMLGVIFLTTWIANLQKGFYTPDGLQNFFTHVYPQSHNPIGAYAAFIENVLLPARAFFAPFQFIAELSLGVFLIAGAFTPLVATGGAFFLANIFLATYGAEWPWTYLSLIGVCIAVAATKSGRTFGVDAFLAKHIAAPIV